MKPVTAPPVPAGGVEQHHEQSRLAQRRADKWMITGAALMGMWAPGLIGFPIFMRGVWLQRQALQARAPLYSRLKGKVCSNLERMPL